MLFESTIETWNEVEQNPSSEKKTLVIKNKVETSVYTAKCNKISQASEKFIKKQGRWQGRTS